MYRFLIRIFLLAPLCMVVQLTIAQKGPVATGGDATGFGGSSSYSIGQIDYIDINSPTGSSYQGLQQPYEIYQLVGTDEVIVDFEISAFPNPVQEVVILQIGTTDTENLTYTLTDMHGRLLRKEHLTDSKTMISLADVAQATYVLAVQKDNAQVKSFKIIKNQ
jgi:hypothetical protein